MKLEINKKMTTTIYDIGITTKMVEEIDSFFGINTQLISIENLDRFIKTLESGKYNCCYYKDNKTLIRKLEKIVSFSKGKKIDYIWNF